MLYNSKSGRATVAARFGSACLFASLVGAAPAAASEANPAFLAEADANALVPGSYQWKPSIAPDGSMNMVVDLSSQRAFVYRDGKLIGVTTIASGKPGYETPDGTFSVLEKQKVHHSNKYDDAPMPYMERLSWSGLALHGGHPHGRPASHGCIRLPMGFAAALFKEQTRGMQVVITGHAPGRPETVMAARERTNARGPKQTDDSPGIGEVDSNTPPCCESGAVPAVQSAASERANRGDADYYNGNNRLQPDQVQPGQVDPGQDVSPSLPAQDLPPPPRK